MKRTVRLILLALLALPALALAQGRFDSVEMKATHAGGSVYMLQGAGGNIGVSVGDDGLLIVDDQFAPLADKIRAALKELGEGKLRFVLNTHYHGDHTGGNVEFGPEAPIISHHNVRKRLSTPQSIRGRSVDPLPREGLPVLTFGDALSIHFNGEEIRAVHFPRGHTDGDTVVFFPESNVVHMGDDMFAGRFPFVDLEAGGSVQGLERNIAAILGRVAADVKIIPGHGPLSTRKDLEAYHEMLVMSLETVGKWRKEGKSLDDMKNEGLPERWDVWGSGFINEPTWLETVHNSLEAGD